jgi:threonine/homoserine/homoserine lactone efflux protein
MDHPILALGSLFLVGLATCMVPGPNNFMLMRLGMRRGRAAALAGGMGTTLSCIVWCAAALLGLAAVLKAAPWLYLVLRVGGGLYLIWFAWSIWRSEPAADQVEEARPGTGDAVWQGFAINMTNPKSVLFFASIFSAYVGPSTPAWMHFAAAAVVTATCLAWQVAMAFLFSAKPAVAAYARAQRPLDRIAAVAMAVFGVSLFFVAE